jgi:hypothetical protein
MLRREPAAERRGKTILWQAGKLVSRGGVAQMVKPAPKANCPWTPAEVLNDPERNVSCSVPYGK